MWSQVHDSETKKMLSLLTELLLQVNERRSEFIINKQAFLTQFHKLGHRSIAPSFSTSSYWKVVNVSWRQAQHCSHHIACYLQ